METVTLLNTSHVETHYTDAEQQREAAKLGMWIFLVTEILLFSGLFVAYGIFRAWYPDMFYNAHKFLDVSMGTLNTVVLITSSLTMALAIRSMQVNKKNETIIFLVLTLIFALVFCLSRFSVCLRQGSFLASFLQVLAAIFFLKK